MASLPGSGSSARAAAPRRFGNRGLASGPAMVGLSPSTFANASSRPPSAPLTAAGAGRTTCSHAYRQSYPASREQLPFFPSVTRFRSRQQRQRWEQGVHGHRHFSHQRPDPGPQPPHSSPRRPHSSSIPGATMLRPKVKWSWIPVSVGIGFIGAVQCYKVYSRENEKQPSDDRDLSARPRRRPRIRPDGPWQVQVMSTLPLKAISRLWGRFNQLSIPYYFRVPGFRLYAYVFGVDLAEVAEPDLHKYPNLAAFFYRTLKPGVRPIDPDLNALVSPADGRILQFGQIEGGDIEQVKGMTYTIDALLGQTSRTPSISEQSTDSSTSSQASLGRCATGDEEVVERDAEFAQVNGISYTLPNLLSGDAKPRDRITRPRDESTPSSAAAVSEVRADLALAEKPWYSVLTDDVNRRHSLYYAVIYLAPGDYHRFHSPTNWVVERRRHFAGELYSVSPYLQRTLPGLFTLNERVVLLGRWRWGFFSYVPVGATNVGSIVVNFDRELRTNSLVTDTAADVAAEQAAQRGEPYAGYDEATYERASTVLGGYALRKGEEMGGFQLGSTIVLVFEAPVGGKEEGEPENAGPAAVQKAKGWVWTVEKGQKIRMGQRVGFVDSQRAPITNATTNTLMTAED